jgi:hypothetical protein
MLQILFYHFFRHLSYRGSEISSCPKMSTPIFLFQVRILFKQLTRRAPLDPHHDLTRCHGGWTTYQYVHMILTYSAFYYPDLKGFTGFSHQVSNALRYLQSILCIGTSLPIQSGTQFEKQCDSLICIPYRTSFHAVYYRS